jgi:hypothetical protein
VYDYGRNTGLPGNCYLVDGRNTCSPEPRDDDLWTYKVRDLILIARSTPTTEQLLGHVQQYDIICLQGTSHVHFFLGTIYLAFECFLFRHHSNFLHQ